MTTYQPKNVLLINPWIYDFAAYDLWAKPLGLLSIGGYLRSEGHRVVLIDCLDVYSPWLEVGERDRLPRKPYHCGKFFREPVEKPCPLNSIPKTYSRYGLREEAFGRALISTGRPDLVLVTSSMTYWYPGVFRVIEILKKIYPKVPVVLGGIYATLCREHAMGHSGADVVFSGGELDGVLTLVNGMLYTPFRGVRGICYPAFDLYPSLQFVCVATSRGCPYRCTYCASPLLGGRFSQRDPEDVVGEIAHWVDAFHVADVAFSDDALLVDAPHHFVPIIERILDRHLTCRFHLPNGIHARAVTREVARLMFRAGFKTIRLGLETVNSDRQTEMGGKVDEKDVRRAIDLLKEAGFSARDIGVYLMAGLPGQPWEEVQAGVDKVSQWGVVPKIAEYSPMPGTALWNDAVRHSSYDLEGEPLFQNNSILPCQWEGFTPEDLAAIKIRLQKRLRAKSLEAEGTP